MDSNFTKANSNRELVNFSQVTEKGLAKLIRGINQTQKVTDTTASNRQLKRQGAIGTEFVKRAIFLLEGGQKLEVSVNDTGVVFQVKINGKVSPFDGDYTTLSRLGGDLGRLVGRNQKRFDKQLAKKAARSADKSKTKPASRPLKARIEEAEKHLSEVQSSHNELKQASATIAVQQIELSSTVDHLTVQLSNETAATVALENELKHAINEGAQ